MRKGETMETRQPTRRRFWTRPDRAGVVVAILISLVAPMTWATVASARPAGCPTGFYRSSCAVINNETEGFAINSASPAIKNGFTLNWDSFQEGSCDKCSNYVHTPSIAPGASGTANIANVGGVMSGATGRLLYQADPSMSEYGTNPSASREFATFDLNVPFTGSNGAFCETTQYLNCRKINGEQGPSKDPWWNFTVSDRPYIITVNNYVEGALTLENASFNHVLRPVGLHTLDSVAAATPVVDASGVSEGTHPGISRDTGLLSTLKSPESTFTMEYRFTSGRFRGSKLMVQINVPLSGEEKTDQGQGGAKTQDSYCNAFQSQSSGALSCSVEKFTANQYGVTRINVTIR
jgi:hypothetical protein